MIEDFPRNVSIDEGNDTTPVGEGLKMLGYLRIQRGWGSEDSRSIYQRYG